LKEVDKKLGSHLGSKAYLDGDVMKQTIHKILEEEDKGYIQHLEMNCRTIEVLQKTVLAYHDLLSTTMKRMDVIEVQMSAIITKVDGEKLGCEHHSMSEVVSPQDAIESRCEHIWFFPKCNHIAECPNCGIKVWGERCGLIDWEKRKRKNPRNIVFRSKQQEELKRKYEEELKKNAQKAKEKSKESEAELHAICDHKDVEDHPFATVCKNCGMTKPKGPCNHPSKCEKEYSDRTVCTACGEVKMKELQSLWTTNMDDPIPKIYMAKDIGGME